MTKRNSRKCLASRGLGVNMWGGSDAFLTKNYPPGMHGTLGYKKFTDYGVQLREKQKVKKYYGNITEKQFRNIYLKASRSSADAGQSLMRLLESRLDAFVYRAKFAPTVFSARQIVNHKHIAVNGKVVNIPSYVLKQGDVVEVRQKSQGVTQLALKACDSGGRSVPGYIELERDKLRASYLRVPEFEEIPYPFEMKPKAVVEFYSK